MCVWRVEAAKDGVEGSSPSAIENEMGWLFNVVFAKGWLNFSFVQSILRIEHRIQMYIQ